MSDVLPNCPTPMRRQFPVLRFVETSGLALSPASIAIAIFTSVLLGLAGWGLDQVFGSITSNQKSSFHVHSTPPAIVIGLVFDPTRIVQPIIPWANVVHPAVFAVTTERGPYWRVIGLIRSVLAFVVWSLIGVILCRRSAYIFAGNDEYQVLQAVNFGVRSWKASLLAPVIPILAVLMIGLAIALIGLLGRFPVLGSAWLAVCSPVITILSLLAATLLLVTSVGWPLMVAAVATDDCDSFGALSRAYSGLTSKPWQVVGYLLISAIVGTILMLTTTLVVETAVWFATTFAALGSGEAVARSSLLGPLRAIVHEIEMGIGISFFWSTACVTYLFLRLEVDGVPFESIVDEHAASANRDPLPVVGIPATDSKPEPPTS